MLWVRSARWWHATWPASRPRGTSPARPTGSISSIPTRWLISRTDTGSSGRSPTHKDAGATLEQLLEHAEVCGDRGSHLRAGQCRSQAPHSRRFEADGVRQQRATVDVFEPVAALRAEGPQGPAD